MLVLVLAPVRTRGDERVLPACNPSGTPKRLTLTETGSVEPLEGHGFLGRLHKGIVELPGCQAFCGNLPHFV